MRIKFFQATSLGCGVGSGGTAKGKQVDSGQRDPSRVQLEFTISGCRLAPLSFPAITPFLPVTSPLSQAAVLLMKYLMEHSHHLPSKVQKDES